MVVAAMTALACGSDGSGGTDASGDVLDIVAQEIREYSTRPREYCVGMDRQEQFAAYDYQCEGLESKGDCLTVENPHEGNDFFCALCGLKGSEMVCYMINPE
jgi:hypothetical protein